jgi:23S rRNA (cytidine1920-2'-O)/16S rRNA (cytidine1409-2'-O)-methyltransferase
MRLDSFLVVYNYIQSRNKATEAIRAKKVKINNKVITKPSYKVLTNDKIDIDLSDIFVSRAAHKLKFFLSSLDLDISSFDVLDIGSSTGGFAQILLQNNINHITCVDVGTQQLHPIVKKNKKLSIYEQTDIRNFYPNKQYDLVTCDVSFISIIKILDDINRLANQHIIILFKPQYEVGKDIKRDSKGMVLDKNAIILAKQNFLKIIKEKYNWQLITCNPSILNGKKGNKEFLFYFNKS